MLTFLAKKSYFWLTFKGIRALIESKKERLFFNMAIYLTVFNLLKEDSHEITVDASHLLFECPRSWTCNSPGRSLPLTPSPGLARLPAVSNTAES